jgi:MFS family permease
MGALADRVRRVRMLAIAVALWAAAIAACAVAPTYGWLLVARLGLGAVTASAGPAVASLTGDLFPPEERGTIYGYILSGELVGAGIGFVISGSVASAVSWRAAFAVLIVPAAALAIALWRGLPEPARGGRSRLEPGAERIVSAEASGCQPAPSAPAGRDADGDVVRRAVDRRRVEPAAERVLHEDPGAMSLARAIGYVLRVPTNRW